MLVFVVAQFYGAGTVKTIFFEFKSYHHLNEIDSSVVTRAFRVFTMASRTFSCVYFFVCQK